jgi:phosphonopyruvate decarboxylase
VTGAAEFLDELERHGFDLLSGVPCSYFAGPLKLLEEHPRLRYVAAANEGNALAVAAGARLAGRRAGVIAQNSGFGNLVNPLTSLVLPYRIPVAVFLSMRAWPDPAADEPQHRWMGRVVPGWLDSLGLPYRQLVAGGPSVRTVIAEVASFLDAGSTVFVLVGKGAIGDLPGPPRQPAAPTDPTGQDLIRELVAEIRDEYLLSTTGYLSRSLYNQADRSRNFYMQGSMGHIGAVALGAALARPDERFVALDGDGALLMHLGALATIGQLAPANLVHVVFDNGAYESTGGQPTPAATTDLAAVAAACGYRRTSLIRSVVGIRPAVRAALAAEGPTLLAVAGTVGGFPGGRASQGLGLAEIAARFAAGLPASGRPSLAGRDLR